MEVFKYLIILLLCQGSNRAERMKNAQWAFLAKEPDCRSGVRARFCN